MKNRRSKKQCLRPLSVTLGAPTSVFSHFLVRKHAPGGYFSVIFWKTAVSSESCSRCSGSIICTGQALRKSVRRATPNAISKGKQQKTCAATSPDERFQSRVCFLLIFCSRPRPKIVLKMAAEVATLTFASHFLDFLRLRSLGRVLGGFRTDSRRSGRPPACDFGTILRRFGGSIRVRSGQSKSNTHDNHSVRPAGCA